MLPYLIGRLHLPPVVVYVIVLLGLLLATFVLAVILHRVFHRWAGRLEDWWGDLAVELLESLVLPLLVLAALATAVEILSLPGRYGWVAGKIIFALVVAVVFNFLAKVAVVFLRRLAARDLGLVRITQPATLFVRVLFTVFALIIFLENLGISLKAVWTTLGVGSLAIGLALQDTLANFFAGVEIMLDRPVSPGDHIKLESGQEGEIIRIGWRATELSMSTGEAAFVPNATMARTILINRTLPELRPFVSVPVRVAAAADVDKVEQTLHEVVKEAAARCECLTLDSPPEVVLGAALTDGFLEFSLKAYLREFADRDKATNEIRKQLVKRFQSGELKKAA